MVDVVEPVAVEMLPKYRVPVEDVQDLVLLIPAVAEVVYTWLMAVERVQVVDQE
tara:strand:+ start:758 stop:919 length:162 start_codon:yes stop_codon:yes gene_type:complete